MLQLTHAAAIELGGVIREQGLPPSAGVRVFGEPTPTGEVKLGVTLAEVPAESDQVTEREGTRLFIAPEVAASLASSDLDIQPTPEGGKLVITKRKADGAD
jgi:Fe-S cluster assembly iron-binding protein IscA